MRLQRRLHVRQGVGLGARQVGRLRLVCAQVVELVLDEPVGVLAVYARRRESVRVGGVLVDEFEAVWADHRDVKVDLDEDLGAAEARRAAVEQRRPRAAVGVVGAADAGKVEHGGHEVDRRDEIAYDAAGRHAAVGVAHREERAHAPLVRRPLGVAVVAQHDEQRVVERARLAQQVVPETG